MSAPILRHCRHCWGNCAGECMLADGSGRCLHDVVRWRKPRWLLILLGQANGARVKRD